MARLRPVDGRWDTECATLEPTAHVSDRNRGESEPDQNDRKRAVDEVGVGDEGDARQQEQRAPLTPGIGDIHATDSTKQHSEKEIHRSNSILPGPMHGVMPRNHVDSSPEGAYRRAVPIEMASACGESVPPPARMSLDRGAMEEK